MLNKIQVLSLGSYKFSYINVQGRIYITTTSIKNYWMRAYRDRRFKLEQMLSFYRVPINGVDCIPVYDFLNLLAVLAIYKDKTAYGIIISYLDKCYENDSAIK